MKEIQSRAVTIGNYMVIQAYGHFGQEKPALIFRINLTEVPATLTWVATETDWQSAVSRVRSGRGLGG